MRPKLFIYLGVWALSNTVAVWLTWPPKPVAASESARAPVGDITIKVASDAGLRLHRTFDAGMQEIYAICDEANGTMLYVAGRRDWRSGPGIAAVPHGCHGVVDPGPPIVIEAH